MAIDILETTDGTIHDSDSMVNLGVTIAATLRDFGSPATPDIL